MKIIQQFAIFFVFIFLLSNCSKNSTEADDETVTDIDGNSYEIVKIGNQWWMAENFKVTRYRNGDAIPNLTDTTQWENLTTGAYCNYDNNWTNVAVYGRLYNWYAVNDSRNIAPEGWHVPSIAEWRILVEILGGRDVAGGKMKEADTIHWKSPNIGATNESGFTGLPGGYRYADGKFYHIGYYSRWWSATENDTITIAAWFQALGTYDAVSGSDYDYDYKRCGSYIRCVKD